MTKRPRAAGTPSKDGNVRSKDSVAPPRPWTKEEMHAAKPLPLPTVEPQTKAAAPGVPHSGKKGQTEPGGQPEGRGNE